LTKDSFLDFFSENCRKYYKKKRIVIRCK